MTIADINNHATLSSSPRQGPAPTLRRGYALLCPRLTRHDTTRLYWNVRARSDGRACVLWTRTAPKAYSYWTEMRLFRVILDARARVAALFMTLIFTWTQTGSEYEEENENRRCAPLRCHDPRLFAGFLPVTCGDIRVLQVFTSLMDCIDVSCVIPVG
jgi:hypothetical protein